MSPQKIRSKKHVRQKRRRRRRWMLVILITAVFLFAGFVGLSHWQAVQIKSFSIETEANLPEAEITEMIDSQLNDNLWYLISRRNVLLLPRDGISRRIRLISSEIREVDIDITGLQTFTVDITTRSPGAHVCTRTEDFQKKDCRQVDKNGFVYSRVSSSTASSSQLLYTVSRPPAIGSQLLPADRFRVLESFLDQLPAVGFIPQQVKLDRYNDVIVSTRKKQTNGKTATSTVDIKINIANDLNQTLADLQTVVEKNAFVASSTGSTTTSQPETVSPFALEYIDLRFGNKVFYK